MQPPSCSSRTPPIPSDRAPRHKRKVFPTDSKADVRAALCTGLLVEVRHIDHDRYQVCHLLGIRLPPAYADITSPVLPTSVVEEAPAREWMGMLK